MSLLLDALKKAADDKQKALHSETISDVATTVQQDVQVDEDRAIQAELASKNETSSPADESNFADSLPHEISPHAATDTREDNEILSLDPIEVGQNESDLTLDETEIEATGEITGLEQQAEKKDKKPVVSNNTVSDEALALLIDKTNRDVRHSKRTIFISVFIATLTALVSGGAYYYFNVQAEVASLESKHQLAMQKMRSKTSAENVPEKSEIIRSFVNKSEPDDRVKLAKEHIASAGLASERNIQKKTNAKAGIKQKKNTAKNDKPVFSIEKTNKLDPLAEKLEAAWLAYENAQYDESGKLYAEVLRIENNNRDALLGLAAVAIHKKDEKTARRHYLALLQQDPRDPIATAAIANLNSDKTSGKSDEDYLLNMLESNPKAAHLNFALGNVYAQQGEWKSAQQSYFNAWQQDNENADYTFNLAISMDQLGKQQQALKFYSESLHKSINKQVSFSREAVQQRIKVLREL